MAASNIALDLETLLYNLRKLTLSSQGISTGQDVIDTISGSNGVKDEKRFHSWLTSAVQAVATTTDTLRADLTVNSDALREAAKQLLEQNRISADESKKFLAMLDAAAARPSPASGEGTASNADGTDADSTADDKADAAGVS
ncbi:hypothetical protein [Schumannella soli]|uniref:Uncharacterized protein n=1 Tax=Schumannella soli TaxID=2590779 RepID=A0A506Y9N9_9MICO|nr:hypothetical protein [Schumannella soli]TPW77838.1 hypothetical protein FJ657_04110 [Schumannella soli]